MWGQAAAAAAAAEVTAAAAVAARPERTEEKREREKRRWWCLRRVGLLWEGARRAGEGKRYALALASTPLFDPVLTQF